MRKLLLAFALLGFYACGQITENAETETESTEPKMEVESISMSYYGDTITTEGALHPEALMAQMEGKDSLELKVEATINETCKMKGCWMTLDMGNGEQMRVNFKDYGFFVPKEGVSGKTAVIQGVAYRDTLSVDYLRHLAEDAEATPQEIAAINEPEVSINFEATGVVIKD
ncbi:MAG TPA: DUF4920 domain-containing protein [Cryomorphaceae bacterium]|nr:DUF4920 domain-containing protein [Cryomorphaceae bacterium]